MIRNLKNANPTEILRFINSYCFIDANIEIALRIFLTIQVTVSLCGRSFSKLKLIKNYLRSTMGQERLSILAIISIENKIAKKVNYDKIIDDLHA